MSKRLLLTLTALLAVTACGVSSQTVQQHEPKPGLDAERGHVAVAAYARKSRPLQARHRAGGVAAGGHHIRRRRR